MAIEIKELLVKVIVEEPLKQKETVMSHPKQDIEKFKAEVIKKCTREILQILKEKQER